jgi:hypothetical protein
MNDGLRHEIRPELRVRVRERSVADARVHARLRQPLGALVPVPGQIVVGLVLVEVVEEARERPDGLVLALSGEMSPKSTHDALDGDKVTHGRVLHRLLTNQGDRFRSLHAQEGTGGWNV